MDKCVFVSFSHKDAKWADEVVQGMEGCPLSEKKKN